MIGQTVLLTKIRTMADKGTIPHFVIIIGQRGSGKRLIAKEIARSVGATFVESGIKADDVREVADNLFNVTYPTLYLFPRVQNMSVIAQNILLKSAEEPPKNVYIVITAETETQVLPTLLNRGTVLQMDEYTRAELEIYANTQLGGCDKRILSICQTPWEVQNIHAYGEDKFYTFLETVVDNIAEVSGANSFKIGQRLNLWGDDKTDLIDLTLFLRAFSLICLDRIKDDIDRYAKGVQITVRTMSNLRVQGVNKQMLFDVWLLDIRKAWMG